MDKNKKKINSLQGIRFYCIVVIFFVHCNFVKEMEDGSWYNYDLLLSAKDLVISFYFILSGYVIALKYKEYFCVLDREKLLDFYKRRYQKMAFVYIITMLLVFFWWFCEADGLRHKFILILKMGFSMTMLQTLTVKYWNLFNAVCWFASCIFVCYLCTPLILYFVQNKKKRFKKMIVGSYAIVVFLILMVETLEQRGVVSASTALTFLSATPYARIWYFAIGMGIAGVDDRNNVMFRRVNGEILSIFIIVVVYFLGLIKVESPLNNIMNIPVLCIFLCVYSKERGRISRFLGNSVNVYLGNISMYFFMLHYVVNNYGGKQLWIKYFHNKYSFWACILMFIVSLLLSSLFHRIDCLRNCKRKRLT